MKRAALAISAVVASVLASNPGAAAGASAQGGYIVTRVALASRIPASSSVAVDPSTGLVYVGGLTSVRGQGMITVINGRTLGESSFTIPGIPGALAVDPTTDTIYAATAGGMLAINGTTLQVTVIPVPASLNGQIAVDPATDTVYAAARLPSKVEGVVVIGGASNSVVATVTLGATTGGASLAVDAATDTVYAAEWAGSLFAINGADNQKGNPTSLSPSGGITGLALDTATGSLYAVDDQNNTVYVVDAATLKVGPSITGCPYHIAAAAADPFTSQVLVTSYGTASPGPADSTCVIDASTNTVDAAATFPRGGLAVAADPATGAAYIAAWNPDNSIWVATRSATDEWSPMVWGFGPSLLGSPSATFAVGIKSSQPLMVSALPAATVTETGALPAGIAMSHAGVFSGTPDPGTAGTYPITVTASNGVGPASTVSLTIVVDVAPAITSRAGATFRTGAHGSFTVRATGIPAPTVSAAGYPSWMTFTPGASSGVLSGTPPRGSGGVWPVYVTAQNGSGITASQTLKITVDQPPVIAAHPYLRFRVGRRVRYLITATGFPTPSLRERGRLPRGLRVRAAPGGAVRIVGKPVRGDKGKRYRIAITARNSAGHSTRYLTIRIR